MQMTEEINDLTNRPENAYNHLKDHRCPRCGKLLARGRITLGFIEIKCNRSRCPALVKITAHGAFLASR